MLGETTRFSIKTPEGVSFSLPIASPFSRCLALTIDYAVVTALTMLLGGIVFALARIPAALPLIGDAFGDFGAGAMIIIQFAIYFFYGIVTEWRWSGQTIGKRLFHLRVIDDRGLSLSLKQVIIRNLFRILDNLPSMFYLVGSLSCFFTKRCQRIGDIAAGTLVVREVKSKPPELGEVLLSKENSFSTQPLLEARLRQRTSPEEARIALDAVTRRNDFDPDSRLTLFSTIADHFRNLAEFPDEVTSSLSDEQYVRNVVDSLFRKAKG